MHVIHKEKNPMYVKMEKIETGILSKKKELPDKILKL